MAEKNEFQITRVINAPQSLVWDVHTKAEHLSKWWGPKGFKMIATKVDLRPGGIFHYGMQAPNGEMMWGKFTYREVVPKEKLVFVVSFSDEQGGTTRHYLHKEWPMEILNTLTLSEKDGKTTLIIKGTPINATEDEINTYVQGFKSMDQGFGGTYDQLDEYLATL